MVERKTLESINWKEKDLEELIENNMDRVLDEENLMPIFTERAYQEEPDIMALDRKGVLYLLELKRTKGSEENLLQVLRYGQIYGQKSYEELEKLYQKFNPQGGSLIVEHKSYFNLSIEEELEREQFNTTQHFLIVTDGTDLKTRNAINYWKTQGLSMDAIVYRVYETSGGEPLIELGTYSPVQDVIEQEAESYIVNTNYKNNINAHNDMLTQKKAAAYYHPWKHKIKRIEKGDKVFLYKSGVGIVAMGIGSGILNVCDYQGHKDEEYAMPLSDFYQLKKPLSAAQMKTVTQSDFTFRQTMFSIGNKGDIIWNYIKKNCM